MTLDVAAGAWLVWDYLLWISFGALVLASRIDRRLGIRRNVWTDVLVWVSLVAIVFAAGATT